MGGIKTSFKNNAFNGKKTYFDVGPTRMPPGYANGQPIQVKYF